MGQRLHDILAAATAAGNWSGLGGELADVAQRARSSDAEPISRAEFEQQRRRFLSALRAAARPYRATGWDLRSNGLAIHGSDGHWGHILFLASGWQRPLAIQIFAGNLSPFLLRVTNGRDPAKPPPLSFVAAHVAVLWQVEIGFQADALSDPAPLDLAQRRYARTGTVLSDATARGWLADTLGRLEPIVRGLCSDLAMRDWILANDADNYQALRDAVLLTAHLGRFAELPALLDRAEQADDAFSARMAAAGMPRVVEDRARRYSRMWSHRRFVRFLNDLQL